MESEKSNLRDLVKMIGFLVLIFFLLWQVDRLENEIRIGNVSIVDDLLDPLTFIRSGAIGFVIATVTYLVIPSGVKELVREIVRARNEINKLKEGRTKLSEGQGKIINYAIFSGASDIDQILNQAYASVTRGSSGKYGVGAIGGGTHLSDELARDMVETLLDLTDDEIVSLKAILDDLHDLQLKAYSWLGKPVYGEFNHGKRKSPTINRQLLIELAEILGVRPSEVGYSYRINAYGGGWYVEKGDKSNKVLIESVESEQAAISLAKKLAKEERLPYQGEFWH